MPDDGNRYELVDGRSSSRRRRRGDTSLQFLNLAMRLKGVCPSDMRVFVAPLDVTYAEDTVVEPDLLVVRRSDLGEDRLEGDPLLAVEVLSPSTRHIDLAFKRARYEAASCPSYWVIDPLEPSIICWEIRDGRYAEVARSAGRESVTLRAPPGQPDPGRVDPLNQPLAALPAPQ